MSRKFHHLAWAMLAVMLLCSCVKSNHVSSSSEQQPANDPPLTFTPPDSSGSFFGSIDPSINPPNSLESSTPLLVRPISPVHLLEPDAKVEYLALKKQSAEIENRISELDNMRRAADHDIIQALKSGGAKMGGGRPGELGFGDTQSYYESPHIFIQNKQWEREFAVNETVEKQRELGQINIKIDRLLNEAAKSCFPATTDILMSDGGVKRIADINVGDSVMVYDIATDTIARAPVLKIFTDDNNHYYQVNERVEATAYERFLTKRGWQKVRDLSLQDEIFNGNGFEKVHSLGKTVANLTVYNLQVDSAHNFFVSGDGESFLLVHNSGGGGGGGGGGVEEVTEVANETHEDSEQNDVGYHSRDDDGRLLRDNQLCAGSL